MPFEEGRKENQPTKELNMGPLDIMKLMKNAKAIQEDMQTQQAKLAELVFVGEAGAGAVQVEMTGKYRALGVKIDPEYANEVEVLQDLIVAAINSATSQIAKAQEENAAKLLGGAGGGLGGLAGLSDLLK